LLLSFFCTGGAYASTSTVSEAEAVLVDGLIGAAEALACRELSSRMPDALLYPGCGELEKPLARVVVVPFLSLLLPASSSFAATVLLIGFEFSRLILPFLSSLSWTSATSTPVFEDENSFFWELWAWALAASTDTVAVCATCGLADPITLADGGSGTAAFVT
jgi:hypothetical protein